MCLHLISLVSVSYLTKRAKFSLFLYLFAFFFISFFLDFANYIGLFLIDKPSFKVGILGATLLIVLFCSIFLPVFGMQKFNINSVL